MGDILPKTVIIQYQLLVGKSHSNILDPRVRWRVKPCHDIFATRYEGCDVTDV